MCSFIAYFLPLSYGSAAQQKAEGNVSQAVPEENVINEAKN